MFGTNLVQQNPWLPYIGALRSCGPIPYRARLVRVVLTSTLSQVSALLYASFNVAVPKTLTNKNQRTVAY
jgi:hypothetical protein